MSPDDGQKHAESVLLRARGQGIYAPLSTRLMTGREAIGECEVVGYRMPAATTALMSQWVVHRDPRYHHNSERFAPRRRTAAYEEGLPRFTYFTFGGDPDSASGQASR